MAFIQFRVSRGKKYWSIVESRRINGKPRAVILEYLGTAKTLFQRLQGKKDFAVRSYSHGDTAALIETARELDVVGIINKHVPVGENGKKPMRDNLTVGASLLLAAVGRACHPTSKLSWYQWCKQTSLEYCLRTSFRGLDSQHFWDQMDALPVDKIPLIEKELVRNIVRLYEIKPDCLFFDTTNFFTFIDSTNERCTIAQRGKNKQKRNDLRQFGVALLVTRKDQFPVFHRTYQGNSNDITVFSENYSSLTQRLRDVFKQISDVTIVFDKGNNSRKNFAMIDGTPDMHYVAGLVPSYFTDLIEEANQHFQTIKVNGADVTVYRVKKQIWDADRTCVVSISLQLKEGQLQGIAQHLKKKYKLLDEFKAQLESPKRRKTFSKEAITERLANIISGQFIDRILKYNFIELKDGNFSFTYGIDESAFEKLKNEVLGRKILATNRHEWTDEDIILAYRGQTKVEYAFRNWKNPFHCATRPQYHWTDQKIQVHVLTCSIGYLLAVAAYAKAKKAAYKRNLDNFLDDLRTIRLSSSVEKQREGQKSKLKVTYALEEIDAPLSTVAAAVGISDENLRQNLPISVYT